MKSLIVEMANEWASANGQVHSLGDQGNSLVVDLDNGLDVDLSLDAAHNDTGKQPALVYAFVTLDPKRFQDLASNVVENVKPFIISSSLFVLSELISETLFTSDRLSQLRFKRRCIQVERLISDLAHVSVIMLEDLYSSNWSDVPQVCSLLERTIFPRPYGPLSYMQSYETLIGRCLDVSTLETPLFENNTVYVTGNRQLGALALGRGWSASEDHFTWSTAKSSQLVLFLSLHPAASATLIVRGHVIGAPLATVISVDGIPSYLAQTSGHSPHTFEVELPLRIKPSTKNARHVVEFWFDKPVSPAELGISGDKRNLALALHSFEIRTALTEVDSHTRFQTILPAKPGHLPLADPRIDTISAFLTERNTKHALVFCPDNLAPWQIAVLFSQTQLRTILVDKNRTIYTFSNSQTELPHAFNGSWLDASVTGADTADLDVELLLLWDPSRIEDLLVTWTKLKSSMGATTNYDFILNGADQACLSKLINPMRTYGSFIRMSDDNLFLVAAR